MKQLTFVFLPKSVKNAVLRLRMFSVSPHAQSKTDAHESYKLRQTGYLYRDDDLSLPDFTAGCYSLIMLIITCGICFKKKKDAVQKSISIFLTLSRQSFLTMSNHSGVRAT